jgi:hypothetical protein
LAEITPERIERFERRAALLAEVNIADIHVLSPLRAILDPDAPDAFGVRTTLYLAQERYRAHQH